MSMKEKIKELLNSVRFWQVTFATAFLLLGHYLPDLAFLWNTLAGYLATIAGVGTVDKLGKSIGKVK